MSSSTSINAPNKEPIASAFKRAQVRYRRQGAAPNRIDDLNELIDFSNPSQDVRIVPVSIPNNNNNDNNDIYHGPLYSVDGFSGFLYAPQALSPSLQLKLAYQSVSEFCEAPHVTNIDGVPPKPNEQANMNGSSSMWDLWKRDASNSSSDTTKKKPYRSFRKLSWATSGYQYDWTTRAYHEGNKSDVPPLLETLSQKFAKTSLFLEQHKHKQVSLTTTTTALNKKLFTPSACIVNYYNSKSIMGGHRDDLELATDKPVISLSIGLAGVFLLGGNTRDDAPILPILVRSGDVLVLGGDCRMNYHGMARVIPDAVPLPEPTVSSSTGEALDASGTPTPTCCVPDGDRNHLLAFLRLHRININVRQVLPDGMDSIPPTTQHIGAN